MESTVVGTNHVTGVDTSADSSGLANEFVVTVFDNLGVEYVTAVSDMIELGSTGSYRVNILFDTLGTYHISIYHPLSGYLNKVLSVIEEAVNTDYDRIQAMITASQEAVCTCTSDSVGVVSLDVKQVMLALGENIVENTTLIKSHSGVTIIS